MKILFTTDTFLPKVRGGAELYLYYLASTLREAGHDVFVMHTENADEFSVSDRVTDGLPCRVIHKPYVSNGHSDFFVGPVEQVERVFETTYDEFRPDVVHINQLKKLSPRIPQISRSHGSPVIFTLHDYWLKCDRGDLRTSGQLCEGPSPSACADCNRWRYARWSDWNRRGSKAIEFSWRGLAKDTMYRFERPGLVKAFVERETCIDEVITNTAAFVCPSRFLMETMQQYGVPAEKLRYSDYGMEKRVFTSSTSPAKRERLRFGFLGGLSELKGIHVLLEAFDKFSDAELWIYGRKYRPLNAHLEKVLAQENVVYQGVIGDEAKASVFANIDALIVPSVWYENSPLVIHEAYLAGVPVITSNIGGMRELVPDRVCGLQFNVGDPNDLRAKMDWLCINREQLNSFRSAIPQIKSIRENMNEMLEIYREFLPNRAEICDSIG